MIRLTNEYDNSDKMRNGYNDKEIKIVVIKMTNEHDDYVIMMIVIKMTNESDDNVIMIIVKKIRNGYNNYVIKISCGNCICDEYIDLRDDNIH